MILIRPKTDGRDAHPANITAYGELQHGFDALTWTEIRLTC